MRRPVGAWIVVVAVAGAVAGALAGGFTDLHVYRHAGSAVLDGTSVYDHDDPVTGLPFTYPPFAALLMVPVAALPGWLAAAVWTGASTACLAATVVVVRRADDRPAPGWLVGLVVAGSLALEPVWQNLSFGQVNTLLMVALLVDAVRPERRLSGVLVGLVAGVKLTPLVFVVLLLAVGHRAAAGRAALTFAATVALGFAVMPAGAASYWTDGLLDARRVGPPALAHNQSVLGALTRLVDGPPSTLVWLAVAGPIGLAVLGAAVLLWRRGDRVLAVGVTALSMLLASPVAWSHHWVWAVPVAVALWERSRWGAVAWTLVFVARPVLWPPWGEGRELAWDPVDHLVGNGYVLAALALAAWAVVTRPPIPARRPARVG
jgi:alpha-1,2-mannosyltransferase